MRNLILLPLLLFAAVPLACGGDDDDAPSGAGTTGAATVTAAPLANLATADDFSPSFTLDVPPDWRVTEVDNGVFILRRKATTDSPPGELWFSQLSSVYDTTEDNAPLETPANLTAFIREHPWLEVLDEANVEIGGLTGVKFEVRPDTDAVPDGLKEWWSLYEETIGTFNVYDGDHFAIYVLDGPDEQIVMAYMPDDPARFDEFAPEAEQIIASVQFVETS